MTTARYMPAYLSSLYPTSPNLLSSYGIIVGCVGSVTVVLGGVICSASGTHRAPVALYLTGVGGMISSIFVSSPDALNDVSCGRRRVFVCFSNTTEGYKPKEAIFLTPSYTEYSAPSYPETC